MEHREVKLCWLEAFTPIFLSLWHEKVFSTLQKEKPEYHLSHKILYLQHILPSRYAGTTVAQDGGPKGTPGNRDALGNWGYGQPVGQRKGS